jgi:hypothetical protein
MYLVALKLEKGNQVYEFQTEETREKFIEHVEKMGVDYATAENND